MNDTQTAEWKKTACIIYCGGGRQGNQLVSTYADSTIKALGVVYRSNALVQPGHIMGLIPCNVIPEEILTDHPNRFRATFIETSISVHSLADSQRMREALRALDISVGIDVARIETARQVDYVLPATCQFEKAEATFFKVEFPRNGFYLRQPLFPSHPGTLTEAEISAPTARRLQGAE